MDTLPSFDVQTIQRVIVEDYPHLNIESIRLIENGWDNVVAEINNEIIFRFPKDADGSEYRRIGKSFEREIKVLNALKGNITLAIPEVAFVGKTVAYMGYKKIPGSDVTQEIVDALSKREKQKLTFDLANFLREIHDALSVEEARAMGVEQENPLFYLAMIQKTLPQKIKDPETLNFINKTCDEYQEMIKEKTETVFLYNDLHTENMAFDATAKKLNGVFDFGDVMIGDINMDFYPLYKFDPYLMKAVAEKYSELTGRKLQLRRMVIYARINELCDLAELIDHPESTVYKNAMMRIEKWKREIR